VQLVRGFVGCCQRREGAATFTEVGVEVPVAFPRRTGGDVELHPESGRNHAWKAGGMRRAQGQAGTHL